MTLPAPDLDTREFQALVSEARERITRTCPEWTDHNVSDPGITLIELFAWMTEMLVFRINRLPRKIHIALLDLLGVQLDSAEPARTSVRFRLASPARGPVRIDGRRLASEGADGQDDATATRLVTEVATRRTPTAEPVVFEVGDTFVLRPPTLVAYTLHRDGRFEDVGVSLDHEARPQGTDQFAFAVRPTAGDALYLGFQDPLDRLVVQIDISAERAHGVGVRPDRPPLRWEVSAPAGTWEPATVLDDGTGGFNYGSGVVELQLPTRSARTIIGGHDEARHWLRCVVVEPDAGSDLDPVYVAPPRITRVSAAAVGALVDVEHAATVLQEVVGNSDGTAGQSFRVRHVPALKLDEEEGETLEVRESMSDQWRPWRRCESFMDSGPDDRVFQFDPVTGELALGPAIRQDDGSWTQHGKLPQKGATLRLTAYRHGGGQRGNVGANTISVLRTSIRGVSSVTNPQAARGGVDAETIERAQDRAALELRAQTRAVTAEDFVFIAEEVDGVARAVCLHDDDAGAVRVHVLPVRTGPPRSPSREDLVNADDLLERDVLLEVRREIDARRLLGTSVTVLPVAAVWVSVAADVRVELATDVESVQLAIEHALYGYLHPWTGGAADGRGNGWPFGRALTVGELYGLVQAIDGVESVAELHMYGVDPLTMRPRPKPIGPRLKLEPAETIASATHTIKVRPAG